MKKTLLSLLFILPYLTNFGQFGHAGHSHSEHKEINLNHLMDGFNMDSAIQIMNEKNIPFSERVGYLNFMKSEFIKNKHPEFNFSDAINNPFRNYKPDNKINTKSIYCTNANFEDFNFTNWSGGIGTYGNTISNTTFQSNGFNAAHNDGLARHTIMTTPPLNNDPGVGPIVGYDPLAINPGTGLAEIPLVAPNGGAASMRLGNANTGAQIERVYYDMLVTANNTSFYYQFAIVLQDPNHSINDQPYFKITVTDQSGNQIGGVCGVYNVNATLAATDPTFVQASGSLYYRPWELVSVDLAAYIGQTVRIEFESADCDLGGHFGYAYVDAGCGSLGLATSFCTSDDSALVVGPSGFDNYQWYGPNDDTQIIPGATDDSLIITNPIIGDTFYISVTSAAGCISELSAVLEFTPVTTGFAQTNNSCPGGATGSATVIGSGSTSGYTYLWTPGNYTTSTVTGLAAGTYNVHIESVDPNCGSADTLITIGESPMIANQASSDFCSGSTYLVAPQGSNYQWYDVNGTLIPGPAGTDDTLFVLTPANGQDYSVIYTNSLGCTDSTVINLNQVTISGSFNVSTSGCGEATVTYFGASNPTFTYDISGPSYSNIIANTSQTTINLSGLDPGAYIATIDDGGCSASSSFDIDFVVSNTPVNTNICPYSTQVLTSPSSGTHTWTDPLNNQTTSTSATYSFPSTPIVAGVYVDTCLFPTGCIEVTNFNVTVTPTQVNPTQNLNPCPLDDVPVTSSSSGTHFWTDPNAGTLGSTTSASFTINDILEGVYTDSTMTTAGCIIITDYLVEYDSIVTNVNHVDLLCYADTNGVASVTIVSGPTGTYNYNWTGLLGYSATGASQNDLFAGFYIVVTTNGNCTKTDTFSVSSPPMPADTLEITGFFCEYEPSAVLYAPVGFTNYQWYINSIPISGENNDTIVITNLVNYPLYSVTYDIPPYGCSRTTTYVNKSTPGPGFLPTIYNNVFSPNNDLKNEVFYPFYQVFFTPQEIEYMTKDYHLYIYNRWGKLMFETDDYTKGWDGQHEGKDCSEEVYFWTLYYNPQCGDDSHITNTSGTVHLVR